MSTDRQTQLRQAGRTCRICGTGSVNDARLKHCDYRCAACASEAHKAYRVSRRAPGLDAQRNAYERLIAEFAGRQVDVETLRELLSYAPLTGEFRWRVALPRRPDTRGQVAGGMTNQGYWVIKLFGRTYRAHRVAWALMTGDWPAQLIDHRDGNRANNVFSNLRDANNRINSENKRRTRAASGYLGVSKHKHKYEARIQVRGEAFYLGVFDTAEEAFSAYVSAKREMHEGCTL